VGLKPALILTGIGIVLASIFSSCEPEDPIEPIVPPVDTTEVPIDTTTTPIDTTTIPIDTTVINPAAQATQAVQVKMYEVLDVLGNEKSTKSSLTYQAEKGYIIKKSYLDEDAKCTHSLDLTEVKEDGTSVYEGTVFENELNMLANYEREEVTKLSDNKIKVVTLSRAKPEQPWSGAMTEIRTIEPDKISVELTVPGNPDPYYYELTPAGDNSVKMYFPGTGAQHYFKNYTVVTQD